VSGPSTLAHDVVVLGTGAAGLIAALAAAESGAEVGIYEKGDALGGTTAVSGGTVWMPCNPHMPAGADSREAALDYLESLSLGLIDRRTAEVIVDDGPQTIRWLESTTPLRFDALPGFPDYHPENPGGRTGRSLDPALYPFVELGEWADRVVVGHRNPHVRLADIPIGGGTGVLTDEVLQARRAADQRGCGGGLVGPLLRALLDRGVEPVLSARATDLVVEDGVVVGVRVERNGVEHVVRAGRGVVIATGGFEWDAELVKAFLRGPMTSPASAPTNTGDGLRMAMRVGADLATMSEAWWVPTLEAPGDVAFGRPRSAMLLRERTLPRSIMVNRSGRRFTNEAANYNAFGGSLHVIDPNHLDYANLPCWLVFDQGFVDRYGFHATPAGGVVPDWVVRAPTLGALADMLGVPGDALAATVERWNSMAGRLRDEDFHRGDSAYDRWMGEVTEQRGHESTIGPLDEVPFYAVEVHSGCLGTKGGPRTDLDGRVLDTRGDAIPGLYAVGNAAAAATGRAYGGAGGTLGPIMVFGRRAGYAAAARVKVESA
jgi:3-oxosteroid 1-dehydrogenase